jgi:hypothetical protein
VATVSALRNSRTAGFEFGDADGPKEGQAAALHRSHLCERKIYVADTYNNKTENPKSGRSRLWRKAQEPGSSDKDGT